MNDLIFPEHKRNANLSSFFRVCNGNELDTGVSKTDTTVTMAPKKVYAVYYGKLCGTETEEN